MSIGLIPHHEGEVYAAGSPAVNPRISAAGLAALLFLATGCAATPAATQPPYLVGISYEVELLAALGEQDPQRRMEQDFRCLGKLGFDTVLIRHAEDRDRPRILEAAQQHELTVGMPSRDVVYYVRTGRVPPGCGSVEALADSLLPRAGEAASICMLGEVVDATTASRLGRLAAAHRGRARGVVTLALVNGLGIAARSLRPEVTLVGRAPEAAAGDGAGDLMLLKCVGRDKEAQLRSANRWLAKYHAGLAAGLTGGLVIDRFRVLPGRRRALVEGDQPADVRRSAAIRRITSRATCWGPKLRRLQPEVIEPTEPASPGLKVVLFTGSKRRFVLVFNASPSDFIHRAVTLPIGRGELASQPVRRAVLVPPDVHVIAGQVVQPRGNRLALPVDLAPGDACLWEVF